MSGPQTSEYVSLKELGDAASRFREARRRFLREHKEDCHSAECAIAYDQASETERTLFDLLNQWTLESPEELEKLLHDAAQSQA